MLGEARPERGTSGSVPCPRDTGRSNFGESPTQDRGPRSLSPAYTENMTPQVTETTWRDPDTALVHGLHIERRGVTPGGGLRARNRTRCGLRPRVVQGRDTDAGDITCVWCRASDELGDLLERLEVPAEARELVPVRVR